MREFWIRQEIFYHNNTESHTFWNAHTIKPKMATNFVHVVEYGALEKTKAALDVAVEALERQQHPHIEQFCKDRAQEALAKIAELQKEKTK